MNVLGKAAAVAALLIEAGVCHAAGWSGDLTVVSTITQGSDDLVIIQTTDGAGYTTGCIANYWIFTADTDARRSRAYATILTAIATGQKIRLWYTDTCTAWSYHQATNVMLLK